ncbi:MAG: alpha/beta hydrolase [Rickettsiales bacterium]|nr:alpha/beta hydrolase [Rickettsiales bacterium]
MTKETMKPTYLTSARGHRIATISSTGQGPRVMFCCGYRSDMASTKATVLADWCAAQNVPFTRFDYFAHGQSDGDFMDFTIGTAMADALEVMDSTNSESIILVGSSMGSWVALNAARERKGTVRGLIGVASAPDFTERLMRARMTPEQRREMDEHGLVWAHSEMTDTDYPITQHFIEEARQHLMLDDVIGLDIPIHLLHGQADVDVPWETSLTLAKQLVGDEVTVTLIKDGDHRLNRPADLELMLGALGRMVG